MRGLAVPLSRAVALLFLILCHLVPAAAEFTQADVTVNNMGLPSIPRGPSTLVIRALNPDGLRVNGGPSVPLTDIPVGLSRWTWIGDETTKPVAYKNISPTFNQADGYYYVSFDTPIDWNTFFVASAISQQVAPGYIQLNTPLPPLMALPQNSPSLMMPEGQYTIHQALRKTSPIRSILVLGKEHHDERKSS